MSTGDLSLAYVELSSEAERATGDRRRLKNLRRRIRRHPTLDDAERAELLERARHVPGCIPPEVELGEDGEVRPVSYEERMADGWLSETEGGLLLVDDSTA